jgi:orotidine-5'-phosphate decarboxylase
MKDLKSRFDKRFNSLQSNLTVGLDPEWEKIPDFLKQEKFPLFTFCKEIIDSTGEFALAFKPNIAFFERFGSKGIQEFEMTIAHIHSAHPDALIIADAKRGDLANTAKEYASYYFDSLSVDSLTVSPYMGKDTICPYIENQKGSVFLLCLTSNPSAIEFQKWEDPSKQEGSTFLYQSVANLASSLNKEYDGRVGIVVGGTRPSDVAEIRKNHPDLFFLIPGFGAQGGTWEEILQASGINSFINSSRGIHFLSSGKNFSELARRKAEEISIGMKNWNSTLSKSKGFQV